MPLWTARYDKKADFSGFLNSPYGPWSVPDVHQFNGDVTVCGGLGIDDNYMESLDWYSNALKQFEVPVTTTTTASGQVPPATSEENDFDDETTTAAAASSQQQPQPTTAAGDGANGVTSVGTSGGGSSMMGGGEEGGGPDWVLPLVSILAGLFAGALLCGLGLYCFWGQLTQLAVSSTDSSFASSRSSSSRSVSSRRRRTMTDDGLRLSARASLGARGSFRTQSSRNLLHAATASHHASGRTRASTEDVAVPPPPRPVPQAFRAAAAGV